MLAINNIDSVHCYQYIHAYSIPNAHGKSPSPISPLPDEKSPQIATCSHLYHSNLPLCQSIHQIPPNSRQIFAILELLMRINERCMPDKWMCYLYQLHEVMYCTQEFCGNFSVIFTFMCRFLGTIDI